MQQEGGAAAMTEPSELTVSEAAGQIRGGALSPVELMESLLARSRVLEPGLRVWVTLDEDAALAAARRSQDTLERGGPIGPLHGIPVGVKDIFYTEGVKTTAGSPIYADFIPPHDSTAVARLKAAGAIMMGKTVTTEFAFFDPPPTRNPWDPAHTPGGSSSGSAAGVAARMFPAALGSQTAGSVLRPASYNGVVGLKPTFGRISRYGVVPVAWSLDTMGFFTRSVEDAAMMLDALAGHDPRDRSSSGKPVPDYARALRSPDAPPRIGLMRQFFLERSDTEVRAHTEVAVRRLGAAGARIEDVAISADFDTLLAAHRVVMSVEAACVHHADHRERPDDYSPKVRGTIEAGMLISGVAYVQALRVRRSFCRQLVKAVRRFGVILTPSTANPAPRDLATTGDPAFQTPWTSCGLPTITLPSGLSKTGMPLGVQLAAGPFEEQNLLAVALWCEQVMDAAPAPPL